MNAVRVSSVAAATLLAFTGLTLTAPAASAQGTEILSAAPKDAKILVGTTSLGELDKNWKALVTAIEMDAMMPFAPTDLLGQAGLDAASLDKTRSVGVAVMSLDDEVVEPPILFLLPVSDYGQWLSSFGPDVKAEGVAEIETPLGMPAYVRGAGRYAVMSPTKALVESYLPQENAAAHYKKRVGAVGAGVIERAQVFAIVDFDSLAPMKRQIIEGMTEAISDQMAMAGAMGMGLPMADQVADMNAALVSMLLDECSAVVAGLRFSERGMAMDFAIQTKEGSEIGALLPGAAESRNLLDGMPDAPFMFAMSLDYGGVRIGPLMDALRRRLGVEEAPAGDAAAPPGMMPMANLWRNTDGVAMSIYPSPGGLTGGLLSRSIFMMSGDSAKIITMFRELMSQTTTAEGMGGVQVTAEYTPDAAEIAGVKADAYAVRMSGPPEMAAQVQQMQQMVYGPAGLQGYVLPVKGGILQTTSRNSELVQQTLASMRGEAPGLGANRVLAAVDAMLPPNPSMRFYIGLGAISNTVGPLLAMGAPGLDIAELKALPPIGMGASVAGGGLVGSMVIPAPVLKAIAEMAQQFGPDLMGGEEGEEEPPLF